MGNFDPFYYPEFSCRTCGEHTASEAGGLCHNCRWQEMIDNDVPDDPPLKECIRCEDLTRNRNDAGEPLCLRCEEEYWAHMADEHSGAYDESEA